MAFRHWHVTCQYLIWVLAKKITGLPAGAGEIRSGSQMESPCPGQGSECGPGHAETSSQGGSNATQRCVGEKPGYSLSPVRSLSRHSNGGHGFSLASGNADGSPVGTIPKPGRSGAQNGPNCDQGRQKRRIPEAVGDFTCFQDLPIFHRTTDRLGLENHRQEHGRQWKRCATARFS